LPVNGKPGAANPNCDGHAENARDVSELKTKLGSLAGVPHTIVLVLLALMSFGLIGIAISRSRNYRAARRTHRYLESEVNA
jgi:hypothetical protein